ncbi:hypothetical protein VFPPC_17822 [Pochonia chlamydosporia 170]|uniref:Uncharacterized protein n=1 Tax=Pochonia chlamydosporia 170 TaxID=1380566 RepID=A0A219AS06_METCM|nr:hypothetical protein VFPPC_17822 [Pochonia chlamydosporia 170]OWT42985.1 hypothetical protein VFPPC_17822 [Pochonia chlamydosporia 170]
MNIRNLALATLLGLGLSSPTPDTPADQNLDKRCVAQSGYCGNGVACCAGLFCSWPNSICTPCGGQGANCGNAVPCCSGFFCSWPNSRCAPCNARGQYCGNAVPCCAGLNCNAMTSVCG